MNNLQHIDHLFTDCAGQRRRARNKSARPQDGCCVVHGGQCCSLPATAGDILISGLTCQPVSSVRQGRYGTGAVESHREYDSYQKVLDLLASRPSLKGGAVEDVLGFSHKADDKDESPLQEFCRKLVLIGRFEVRVIILDNTDFIKFQRKRLLQAGGTV